MKIGKKENNGLSNRKGIKMEKGTRTFYTSTEIVYSAPQNCRDSEWQE